MKKQPRLDDYLRHIEEAALLACSYVSGMDKTTFFQDKRTQQAVIYNIMIIGEAATQVINEYPQFTESHPEIPWREMRGIRNRMAHGYFALNVEIIWDTVTTSLEPLQQQVQAIR